MSHSQNIQARDGSSDVAPTPQNTPLDTTVLASRPANLGKPQVEDIGEGEEDDDGGEDVSGMNPASLLAKVSVCDLRAARNGRSKNIGSRLARKTYLPARLPGSKPFSISWSW